MAEMQAKETRRVRRLRHRGRGSQVPIYLGKQLRFFINQSDWKVLPMAAIIAALVSMVIHKDFFVNMEGNLMGSFALTCVAIWNGCFNSIQAICRERQIVKREHRSGMHVSAYIGAHMIYQFGLCAAQTALSLYVMLLLGVQFPDHGFITPWIMLDLGISMLLIAYASDMVSLLVSSLAHTTTGAMTIMPFVLIFQLVFSGGMLELPKWTDPICNFTISNHGLCVISALSGYNESPMETGWKTLVSMKDDDVGGTFTLGDIMDFLNSPGLDKYGDKVLLPSMTLEQAAAVFSEVDGALGLREREINLDINAREVLQTLLDSDALAGDGDPEIAPGITLSTALQIALANEQMAATLDKPLALHTTVGEVLDTLKADEAIQQNGDKVVNEQVTLSDLRNLLNSSATLQAQRDREFTVKFTIGDLLSAAGEERVEQIVKEKTGLAAYNPNYNRSIDNIINRWLCLCAFVVVFALLSACSLKMIDHDKR